MLSAFRTAVMNVAAASGLVTFASFAYSTYKDVKIQQVNFEQAWQQSEIYGIVFEHSPRGGADFGQISAELDARIRRMRQPLGLTLSDATSESVRSALMALTERGVILLREDFRYIVPMAPVAEPDPVGADKPTAARSGALVPAAARPRA
jgi:hypothetical protein